MLQAIQDIYVLIYSIQNQIYIINKKWQLHFVGQ